MEEVTLDAITGNIPPLTDLIDAELEKYGCPDKARMQIDIAIDEIFCNIARYAYGQGGGQATVKLDFDEANRVVSLTFRDKGVAFDPSEAPEPDISLMLDERPVGGLGLFMVKKMMDGVEYRREHGYNVLTLRKRL